MQAVSRAATRYDLTTIWFHWLTLALVTEQWIGAQLIDLFTSGSPRVAARSVHIVLGVLLVLLLVGRISWRLTRGRRLPEADGWPLNLAATAAQLGLYALLIGMVGSGLALSWARGDSIFGLVSIPAYEPGNRALVRSVKGVHSFLAWAILILGGVHGAAALAHHFVWRDGVLARMWR